MSHNITVEGGKSVRLPTKGKYCDRDIVITAEGGAEPVIEPLVVLENGTYTAPDGVDGYSPVIVNVEAGGGSGEEWIGDGNTHLWIHLEEGRTAPMVGVCPNGTVTVDWGDGSEPDVLTGTSVSTVKWTPNHEYGKAGSYVISLTVDGEMGFRGSDGEKSASYILRQTSSGDGRNFGYMNAVGKIEVGSGVTAIKDYAFKNCYSLASIVIPDSVTTISSYAFQNCYSLSSIVIPDSVTTISSHAFQNCYSLASIVIPDSVTAIKDYAFQNCYSLSSIVIPDSVTTIDGYAFQNCYSLASIVIPDSVTTIGYGIVYNCYALASIVIPGGVTTIRGSTFYNCYSVRYYDFTKHTTVPTLPMANVFTGIAADCEIRVPAALYDEWIAATNWAAYAANIVAV